MSAPNAMKGSPQKLTRAAALPSPTSTITNEILSLSSLQKGSSTFDWPEQAFILGKDKQIDKYIYGSNGLAENKIIATIALGEFMG